MTSYQTGARYERELVTRFRDHDWGALRLPSSGSATQRELPDVLAGKRTPIPGRDTYTDLVAIELKAGKQTTLYVKEHEVTALRAFAQRWGAQAYLGARYTTRASPTDTYLVSPDDARGPTTGGNYGLPVNDIVDRASMVVGSNGITQS